jgi:hypothetical protein
VWDRNDKGNLTRKMGALRLVVFRKFDGTGYSFTRTALVGSRQTFRSPETFTTEEEAKTAAETLSGAARQES